MECYQDLRLNFKEAADLQALIPLQLISILVSFRLANGFLTEGSPGRYSILREAW